MCVCCKYDFLNSKQQHAHLYTVITVCDFSVDECGSYCVTRRLAADNQNSSECVASPEDLTPDQISLTNSEDLIRANCCAAGFPLPFVSWVICTVNSTNCSALTNTTQSTAELVLTGSDLPEGNSSLRCVAEYLDVTEIVRTLWLNVEKQGNGKKRRNYRPARRKIRLCFMQCSQQFAEF